MNITDVMTKDVSTCDAGDNLNRAAQLMWDRRCGCLPVLDPSSGSVVGMLTDRDVCMAAYTQGRRLDDLTVGAAMSRPPRVCLPTMTIEDAEDQMMAYGVRRLIVVDGDGRLEGLVSLDDIARRGAAWDRVGDVDLERVALTLAEISQHTTATLDEDGPDAPSADPSEVTRNSLEVLKTLRDEIRVDLNLAGKEVRDRWRRLETSLRAAETRVRETRRDSERSLRALVDSAKRFRRRLRTKKTAVRKRAR